MNPGQTAAPNAARPVDIDLPRGFGELPKVSPSLRFARLENESMCFALVFDQPAYWGSLSQCRQILLPSNDNSTYATTTTARRASDQKRGGHGSSDLVALMHCALYVLAADGAVGVLGDSKPLDFLTTGLRIGHSEIDCYEAGPGGSARVSAARYLSGSLSE